MLLSICREFLRPKTRKLKMHRCFCSQARRQNFKNKKNYSSDKNFISKFQSRATCQHFPSSRIQLQTQTIFLIFEFPRKVDLNRLLSTIWICNNSLMIERIRFNRCSHLTTHKHTSNNKIWISWTTTCNNTWLANNKFILINNTWTTYISNKCMPSTSRRCIKIKYTAQTTLTSMPSIKLNKMKRFSNHSSCLIKFNQICQEMKMKIRNNLYSKIAIPREFMIIEVSTVTAWISSSITSTKHSKMKTMAKILTNRILIQTAKKHWQEHLEVILLNNGKIEIN